MSHQAVEENLAQKISAIVTFIQAKITTPPTIGLILGTGLGEFAQQIKDAICIPYTDIPYLPAATAPGHSGNLIFGWVGNHYVVAMQGRLHLYEGNTPQMSSILVRVMKTLGIATLIIACAAGGLNKTFQAGDIMLINDHINLTGLSPLTGPNLAEYGPRFPIMFDIYDQALGQLSHEIALEQHIHLQNGVYVGYCGPHYCTRAELNYFTLIGGDAVGMSLVHEAIAAAHCGIKILALAAITDLALPYAAHHASEVEVIAAGQQITAKFNSLINHLLLQI